MRRSSSGQVQRLSALLILAAAGAAAQAVPPACIDAYQTMVRANEDKLRPGADLSELHFTISQRTSDCPDLRELWLLRAELAKLSKNTRDQQLSERRASEITNGIPLRTIQSELARRSGGFDPNAPVRRRLALVAGSSRFLSPDLNPLAAADKDVTRMAALLKDTLHFDDVHAVAQKEFTMGQFRKEFSALRAQAEPEDLVVIYLATHALQPIAGTKDDVAFLVFYDSDVSTGIQRYATSIGIAAFVQEAVREIRARRLILILDTCFSGDAIDGQRTAGGLPSAGFLDTLVQNSGRAIIASAGKEQTAQELKGQGVFLSCFDKTISSRPNAPVGQWFAEVDACVPDLARSLQLPPQDPEIYSSASARETVLAR